MVKNTQKFDHMVYGWPLGNLLGVLLIGPVADWYGRKIGYLTFLTLWMIFSIASHFAQNIYVWISFRFVVGASSIAFLTASTIYSVELTSGKWRSFTNHVCRTFVWNLGIHWLYTKTKFTSLDKNSDTIFNYFYICFNFVKFRFINHKILLKIFQNY